MATTNKIVNSTSLEKMITLQKGYMDAGDERNAQAITELGKEVARNTQQIDLLTGYHGVVGEFPHGTTDFIAKEVLGDTKHLLKLFCPVLISVNSTDTTGHKALAMRLRRNNYLRFEDGTFAPVVAITEAMWRLCNDHDIYVKEGDTYTQVYAAGQYDPEAQWEVDKELIKAGQALTPLYIAGEDGTYTELTHRLRPWETIDAPFTIGIANTRDLYLLDNQQGASGKWFKGIFFSDKPYDGIEIAKWKLPPTAISPCPITTVNEDGKIKARNFFYLYQGMVNCQSNKGLLPINPFYESDRTYPRTVDISQVTNMQYARNNNADVNASYPFAEGGYFAWNVFITALELAAKSRFIHAANLFGSGLSSNDGCNANNFFTSGGIRFREANVADAAWNYRHWGSNSAPLQYSIQGTHFMSNLLTGDYPLEQCMESQLAASMATELGINPTTEDGLDNPNTFEFYGNTYYFMNVPGFDGLQEGDMNVRVYKVLKGNIEAWKAGKPQTWETEIIQRMSLFNGVNLCGDIGAYNGGGLEVVGTLKEGDTAGILGNTIRIYVEPDQIKWHNESALTIPLSRRFAFEDTYQFILETVNQINSYTLTREGYTPWKTAMASSMAQGECYYHWSNAYWGAMNNSIRVGVLFRSRSLHPYSSPRTLTTYDPADKATYYFSGTSQVLVELLPSNLNG